MLNKDPEPAMAVIAEHVVAEHPVIVEIISGDR